MCCQWAVQTILTNPVYAGDLVSGRVLQNMHKRTKTTEDEWVIHKDHHEAIVDRATFDAVQSAVGRRAEHDAGDQGATEEPGGQSQPKMPRQPRQYEHDPLEDVMYCACCGARLRMERRGKNKNQRIFVCVNHTGLRPSGERLPSSPKAEAVKIRRTLTRNAKRYVDELRTVKVLVDGAERHGGVLDLLTHESALVLAAKKEIEANGIHLMDDLRSEVLDQETYLAARERYKELLKEKEDELSELMSKQRQLTVKLDALRPFLKEKTVGSGMDSVRALGMVDRIDMKANGRIQITFQQYDNIRFVLDLMEEMKAREAAREGQSREETNT